jgi:hypothetical protein
MRPRIRSLGDFLLLLKGVKKTGNGNAFHFFVVSLRSRAPVRLSAEARAKRAERLRQSRDLSARKPNAIRKSAKKKQNKGKKLLTGG